MIVENDEGEIVREFLKEIDTIVLYKSMREVLVYLTHLDVIDTEIISESLPSRSSDSANSRRTILSSDGEVIETSWRNWMVLGQSEHAVLGYWFHLGSYERRNREAFLGYGYQRFDLFFAIFSLALLRLRFFSLDLLGLTEMKRGKDNKAVV